VSLVIVDLGCGNVGSVAAAFARLGAAPSVTSDREAIADAERLVLPGVGAAGHAMARIDALGLRETLVRFARPLLGICLGMQLLFEGSAEDDTPCLGLLPGRSRRLEPAPGRPVPHMGWSRLTLRAGDAGLSTGDYAYFAHSFACADGPDTLAAADHNGPFAAAVRRGNLLGAQFHPERSAAAGSRFLAAFLSC
jgi:glutamine amidotransferase